MSTTPISAVMFFVERPAEVSCWWATHLGSGAEVHHDGGFSWFDQEGVEIGFHPSDPAKNPVGGSPVVYWAVDDLDAARTRLITAGCTPHRGPLTISDERRICQLVDPFGNTFGLDGRQVLAFPHVRGLDDRWAPSRRHFPARAGMCAAAASRPDCGTILARAGGTSTVIWVHDGTTTYAYGPAGGLSVRGS